MKKNRMRPVKSGRGMRMSFSTEKEVLDMPNLIEVQKNSQPREVAEEWWCRFYRGS